MKMLEIDVFAAPPTQDEIEQQKNRIEREINSPPKKYVWTQSLISLWFVFLLALAVWHFKMSPSWYPGFQLPPSQEFPLVVAGFGIVLAFFDRSKTLFNFAIAIFGCLGLVSFGVAFYSGLIFLSEAAMGERKDIILLILEYGVVGSVIGGVPAIAMIRQDYSPRFLRMRLGDLEHVDPEKECETLLEWVQFDEVIAKYVHAVTRSGRLLTRIEREALGRRHGDAEVEREGTAAAEKTKQACKRLHDLAFEGADPATSADVK